MYIKNKNIKTFLVQCYFVLMFEPVSMSVN